MERVQPKEFVKYVNLAFKDHPFSDEALLELAILSQGIWRRFKWYINDCLIKADEEDKQKINAEDVKRWIGIDRIVEDMKLELVSVFSKSELRREAAAKILIFLGQEERSQSDIRKHIEVSAMECSRILNKLKEKNYINSKRKGVEGVIRARDLDDLLSIMRKLRRMRERETIKRLKQREVKIPKGMMLG